MKIKIQKYQRFYQETVSILNLVLTDIRWTLIDQANWVNDIETIHSIKNEIVHAWYILREEGFCKTNLYDLVLSE